MVTSLADLWMAGLLDLGSEVGGRTNRANEYEGLRMWASSDLHGN